MEATATTLGQPPPVRHRPPTDVNQDITMFLESSSRQRAAMGRPPGRPHRGPPALAPCLHPPLIHRTVPLSPGISFNHTAAPPATAAPAASHAAATASATPPAAASVAPSAAASVTPESPPSDRHHQVPTPPIGNQGGEVTALIRRVVSPVSAARPSAPASASALAPPPPPPLPPPPVAPRGVEGVLTPLAALPRRLAAHRGAAGAAA
ncbi:hypothetical protein KUF71_015073, partial [Frankliniella fusca]